MVRLMAQYAKALHLVLQPETLDTLDGISLATNSGMISTLLELSGTEAELIQFNLITLW